MADKTARMAVGDITQSVSIPLDMRRTATDDSSAETTMSSAKKLLHGRLEKDPALHPVTLLCAEAMFELELVELEGAIEADDTDFLLSVSTNGILNHTFALFGYDIFLWNFEAVKDVAW